MQELRGDQVERLSLFIWGRELALVAKSIQVAFQATQHALCRGKIV
jgi:hypothetical protein